MELVWSLKFTQMDQQMNNTKKGKKKWNLKRKIDLSSNKATSSLEDQLELPTRQTTIEHRQRVLVMAITLSLEFLISYVHRIITISQVWETVREETHNFSELSILVGLWMWSNATVWYQHSQLWSMCLNLWMWNQNHCFLRSLKT